MKLFNPLRALPGAVVLFALLLIAGCGGDDPKPVSKIVGKWNVVTAVPNVTIVGGGTLVDFLIAFGFERSEAELYAAELMNTTTTIDASNIEFKADGTYESIGGTDKSTGKWELSSDEKILTTDKGTSGETIANVNKLDDTDLVLEFDFSDDAGIQGLKYVVLVSLQRQ